MFGDRAEGIVVHIDVAPTIVANSHEQVQPVTAPLDAHSPGVARVDERQDGVAHDRACGLSDVAR